MIKKIAFFVALLFGVHFIINAQDVPLGDYKSYLPYNSFHSVAESKDFIYAATTHSIMQLKKNDNVLDYWSKVEGLSDVGVQAIHYDNNSEILTIVYTNSNVDLVRNNKIFNIRDILNKQIVGSKIINRIYTTNNCAYFACDFGVVILDLQTLLITDSWFTIRQNVPYAARDFTIHQGRYYVATDKGIFSVEQTSSNPADFSKWQLETQIPSTSFQWLCSYNDKLYAVQDNDLRDTTFYLQNMEWKKEPKLIFVRCMGLERKNGKMIACDWDRVIIIENETIINLWFSNLAPGTKFDAAGATIDNNGNIWVSDLVSGIGKIFSQSNALQYFQGVGPATPASYQMTFVNGKLAVVPGSRNSAVVPEWVSPAISTLKDGSWWYHTNFKEFKFPSAFNSVAVSPTKNEEMFMASWNSGLYFINQNTLEKKCYNGENSPLISEHELGHIFVSGVSIDKENRLWMLQSGVTNLVKVKDLNQENSWYSFNLSPIVTDAANTVVAEHLLIDSRNYKWITVPRSNQLVCFFENGSLTNTANHKKAKVDLNSTANIQTSRIQSIAEDREGKIWIGTEQGIKVVNDAGSVFNRQLYAKNILLEQNGYVQNLLEFESITCIAVDGANRKWVGTSKAGVYLVSPSGTQELLHLTIDDSPLFSNTINDIKINPENGEVFIATADGLLSYRGTATTGKENYKEILAYPNPVQSGYSGPIAVKGLMEDSFCKIVDAAGQLVWQGYAYGGQLIWNGKDFNGKRPASGVYFVFASNNTGKIKKVAKILFLE